MNRLRPAVLLLLCCAGCASAGDPPNARGWVGGAFEPVVADAFMVGKGPALGPDRIVGVPGSAKSEGGALVSYVAEDAPLAAAGLRPGDLLLTVGDVPVGDADEVRAAIEPLAPGTPVRLRWWRDGAIREGSAVVGTETWQKSGMFRIGLGLRGKVDLWPFDDGIDLFGLIVARSFDGADPSSAGGTYLARAYGGKNVSNTPLRGWEVFVCPVGFGGQETVVDQRAGTGGGAAPSP